MAHPRRFRFSTGTYQAASREELAAFARKAESLGYATVVTGDHITFGGLAPMPLLVAIADATKTLRVGTTVFANGFRNVAMLAHEAATVDVLSGGRLDLGLGAGWHRGDFEAAGLVFEPHAVRHQRLAEAIGVLKRLFQEEEVSHAGAAYRVRDLTLVRPVQRPHPPIFIGGGGRKTLELAAREADIVGIDLQSSPLGGMDALSMTAASFAERVGWVREAAGARFDALELHVGTHYGGISDDVQAGIDAVRAQLTSYGELARNAERLTDQEIVESPYVLIGSEMQIAEKLLRLREQYSLSYIGGDLDAMAPVVARLAGT